MVRIAILLGEEDGGDARRRVQDGCRGRARLGGAGEDGQEDDRIQPGTCRQRGAGVGYQQIPGLGQGSEVALTPTFPTLSHGQAVHAVFAGDLPSNPKFSSARYEELWSIIIGVILIELEICAPIMEII